MSLQSIGKIGEEMAQKYLLSHGFNIKERNFRTKLGELDIIGEKGDILYFIEVKTRIGDKHGKPYEAITLRKLHHIRRVAQVYLLQNKITDCKLSIQVISIELLPTHDLRKIKMYEVI